MLDGITVGALAAVNAAGSVTIGDSRHFWAAPFEQGKEFGGCGPAVVDSARMHWSRAVKGSAGANTTLVVVATDAILTKAQAKRLAVMAQTGLARAIYPVHTPLDGDVLFAAATGKKAAGRSAAVLSQLGAIAANVTARAIARAVYEATRPALPRRAAELERQVRQLNRTAGTSVDSHAVDRDPRFFLQCCHPAARGDLRHRPRLCLCRGAAGRARTPSAIRLGGRFFNRKSATITIAARSLPPILKKALRRVWRRITERRRAGNQIGDQPAGHRPERQSPMRMAVSQP